MFRELPKIHDEPAKANGEGWLVSSEQQQLVRFRNDTPSANAEWVTFCTYSWKPSRPTVSMAQRWMLQHHAISVSETMNGLAAMSP